MANSNRQPKPSNQPTEQPRQLKLNPTIRSAQFISIMYLILVTGVTLLGQWLGVEGVLPNVRVVALTLFAVASIVALGSTALLESTAKER